MASGMTMIAHSSTKFVQPVGFSNGWAEFVLKNPPPFVPSCLMATWLATGPAGDRLRRSTVGGDGRVDGRGRREPGEVLHDAAAGQHDRHDERQRQQDPQRRAHEVDPEVAERAPRRAG